MSGRKNYLPPYHAIVAGNLAGNVTSPTIDIRSFDNIAVQLNCTGSPTGVFSVNVSLDQTNWVPLSVTPSPALSGNAAVIGVEGTADSWSYLQVVYTATSGTGSVDMYISAKGE